MLRLDKMKLHIFVACLPSARLLNINIHIHVTLTGEVAWLPPSQSFPGSDILSTNQFICLNYALRCTIDQIDMKTPESDRCREHGVERLPRKTCDGVQSRRPTCKPQSETANGLPARVAHSPLLYRNRCPRWQLSSYPCIGLALTPRILIRRRLSSSWFTEMKPGGARSSFEAYGRT